MAYIKIYTYVTSENIIFNNRSYKGIYLTLNYMIIMLETMKYRLLNIISQIS